MRGNYPTRQGTSLGIGMPRAAGRCRLVAYLSVAAPSSVLESARLTLLAFGDLLMMRKQLNTLKERRTERQGIEGSVNAISSLPGRGLRY